MTETVAARPGGLAPWQVRTVLVVLLSGQLLSALDQTIVGTVLPTIVGQLGSLDDFALVVTAYLLTSTVSTALYGKLADLYGPKPMYLVAIGVFTVGSLAVGLSQDMTQMVAFRALQGLGAGGLVVLAFTISSSVVPPRQIGRVQGMVGAMYALASLAGPLIGGAFTAYVSWRWAFLVNVPIGVLALVAVATSLKLPVVRREHTVDYLGAVLLGAGVSTLVLATVRGDWTSTTTIALLAATAVLTVAFILRQRSAPEPLVPLDLLRGREVGIAMVVTFLVGVAIIGGYFFLPIYLQVVRGQDPVDAGLNLLPLMIAVMIGSGLSGWLISSVLGRMKPVVVAGCAIMTVSLYLFSTLDAHSGVWSVWGAEAVLGVGMGMVISKLIVAVQNAVPREHMGTITAQAAFFRTIGSSIGAAVFGALVASRVSGADRVVYTDPRALPTGLAERFADALRVVFWAGVPVMLAAVLLTLLLPNTRLRADVSPWGEEGQQSEQEEAKEKGIR
ncbi:MDR family MFS transporter [Actinokineospora enzanensis]|uniref:MDR family MFS transporter n=1 Tax=Actinokineospora enzanensis TaxID=155975 RepID=UPI0012EBAAC6|nr:MDR family MFS transporter [Actinokineospora enzanensis]